MKLRPISVASLALLPAALSAQGGKVAKLVIIAKNPKSKVIMSA